MLILSCLPLQTEVRMEERKNGRMEGWKDGRGEDKEGIGGRMEGGGSLNTIEAFTPEDAIGNQSNLKGIE